MDWTLWIEFSSIDPQDIICRIEYFQSPYDPQDIIRFHHYVFEEIVYSIQD